MFFFIMEVTCTNGPVRLINTRIYIGGTLETATHSKGHFAYVCIFIDCTTSTKKHTTKCFTWIKNKNRNVNFVGKRT